MTDKIQRSIDYNGLFRVGDICIGKGFTTIHEQKNGMECEIVGPLGKHSALHMETGDPIEIVGYIVRWANQKINIVNPIHLAQLFCPARHPPKTTWEKFTHLTGIDPRVNPKKY